MAFLIGKRWNMRKMRMEWGILLLDNANVSWESFVKASACGDDVSENLRQMAVSIGRNDGIGEHPIFRQT